MLNIEEANHTQKNEFKGEIAIDVNALAIPISS